MQSCAGFGGVFDYLGWEPQLPQLAKEYKNASWHRREPGRRTCCDAGGHPRARGFYHRPQKALPSASPVSATALRPQKCKYLPSSRVWNGPAAVAPV